MQQQITDIASLVFWTNVRNKTFDITRILVLTRQFEKLWLVELLPLYLDRLNFEVDQTNNEGIFEWLYNKVNEFMYNLTLKREKYFRDNIFG